jgi:hypothetical protein
LLLELGELGAYRRTLAKRNEIRGNGARAARAYGAVLGAEWRAAKRIGSTMTEDLGSIPQIPNGGIQKGSVGPGQSGH